MQIHVEKFGGASVNSAKAVRNVINIIKSEEKKRIIVISAMGKTTNALEKIAKYRYETGKADLASLQSLKDYHNAIITELFPNSESALSAINDIFSSLEQNISSIHYGSYDKLYDSIVSFGEIISTTIVSLYLNAEGIRHKFIMAADIIKTDDCFRSANVDWDATKTAIYNIIMPTFENESLILTQGFIASTNKSEKTTLGREGSDYTAAILAHCINATDCTIWKDVEGLLNADPKRMSHTTKINSLPYEEAVELAYYGATIIHPKTIKPLENRNIPLFVRSFLNPAAKGSVICRTDAIEPPVASYIFKDNQTLLSLYPKDFSFITEANIGNIFEILASHNIKVNLMQNSAVSFSVCFDNTDVLPALIEIFRHKYRTLYNEHLRLMTIRHYTQAEIDSATGSYQILIEQRSRTTAQFLVR
ncbi:MAG: aspartate kinase [Bacteroidales bacterium]|jgi:aspartate kinase|nr:aspartate kinase [Bacteroidales bacterium]